MGHAKTSNGCPIIPLFREFLSAIYQGFYIIVQPLIELTRKGMSFQWTPSSQHAFDLLKQVFTNAPVLVHVDPTKPFEVETDASDFAIGAILSESADDGILHPVAYYSRKFAAPEINYPIYIFGDGSFRHLAQ